MLRTGERVQEAPRYTQIVHSVIMGSKEPEERDRIDENFRRLIADAFGSPLKPLAGNVEEQARQTHELRAAVIEVFRRPTITLPTFIGNDGQENKREDMMLPEEAEALIAKYGLVDHKTAEKLGLTDSKPDELLVEKGREKLRRNRAKIEPFLEPKLESKV